MDQAYEQTDPLAADTEPPSARLHPPAPSEGEVREPAERSSIVRLQLCSAKAAADTKVKSTGCSRAVALSPEASGRKGSSERTGL
jgi:hypothetical protein